MQPKPVLSLGQQLAEGLRGAVGAAGSGRGGLVAPSATAAAVAHAAQLRTQGFELQGQEGKQVGVEVLSERGGDSGPA